MERKIFVIILAGGSGHRMGSGIPKQFLEIDGIPVLQRTISRFVSAWPSAKIVTVLPKEHLQTWKTICEKNCFFVPQTLVQGGISRFHSVQNALKKIPDGAIVAIQDGVRPLVSESLLHRMMDRMESCRALAPCLPVYDSLKYKNGALPEPDRDSMVCVQTPQIFLSEDIKDAYCQAYDVAFTDDLSVAARKQIPLSYIEGERTNIKITTPEDLKLAELYLKSSFSL